MSTNQAQPPAGPIAQQLAKIQSNAQQPAAIQPLSQQQKKMLRSLLAAIWAWTEFAKKKGWDWLQLLLIPVLIAAGGIWFQMQQHNGDQQIAADQQKEDVLVNYQKDISDLLLNYKLGSSKEGDPVTVVARAKTLTALRKLDSDRKGTLVQFLYEAKLIGGVQPIQSSLSFYPAIVSLNGADLSNANLEGINLRGADLEATSLLKANLRGADLRVADLETADLKVADLSDANLEKADLFSADLKNATIIAGQLAKSKSLKDATLPDGSTYPSKSYPIPNHKEP